MSKKTVLSKRKSIGKTEIRKPEKNRPKEKAKRSMKKNAMVDAEIVHTAKQGKTPASAVKKPKEIAYKVPDPEVVAFVEMALEDSVFTDYISKNVGSQANGLLKRLLEGPQKDEALAEKAEIKLNEVRRALNLLNRYGMVRYDVKRDNTGWLTFEWHVDYVAFSDFYRSLNKKIETKNSTLPEECNDFFVCLACSKLQGFIYPFDVAYDKSFKCNCGKSLESITRKDAEEFIRN